MQLLTGDDISICQDILAIKIKAAEEEGTEEETGAAGINHDMAGTITRAVITDLNIEVVVEVLAAVGIMAETRIIATDINSEIMFQIVHQVQLSYFILLIASNLNIGFITQRTLQAGHVCSLSHVLSPLQ